MRLLPSLLALAVASLLPTTVLAQQAPADAEPDATWEVAGSVAATSDYIWRGVSQTQGNPALQIDVSVTHASGFYAGAWASNVDFTAAGEDDDGIDIELDPYIGWSGALGDGAELDVFLTYVSYPGHRDGYDYAYTYTELEGVLTFADHFHVGLAYSPDIFNLGGHGIYSNAGVELPLGESGFDLKAQVGHYNLNDAVGDSYNDFQLGLGRSFGPLRADLLYTDTSSYGEALSEGLDDASQADGRVSLQLTWEF